MDPVLRLPITRDVDPNAPTLEEAVERIEAEAQAEPSRLDKLMALAKKTGNFADAIDEADLVKLGAECVEDYEKDKEDRGPWEDTVKEALKSAAQSPDGSPKDYPWKGASNVKYPILTTAALQFWARMLPAVIKGDEAVLCKVIGQDEGKPQLAPNGERVFMLPDGPVLESQLQGAPPEVQQMVQPAWRVPPGAKTKRARRVSEYLNTTLFYRMEDWESDTSSLLMQLPTVGCVFRKSWWDKQAGLPRSSMVSALRIFVPKGAKSCETTPRLTEEIPDVYPHSISEGVRSGHYRDVELFTVNEKGERAKEDDGPRLLLEQHRLIDLDEDGFEEPYIVTVDHKSHKVLRIEANFAPEGLKLNEEGQVMRIERGRFYTKYGLFPHPEGDFYDIGLGHLLKQMGGIINTAINQLMDAGHAQTAGGGFIGSGVRLQSRGGGSVIRYEPGTYRTVDVSGDVLRNAIVERTAPQVSPITFQVLDLILGAARDISGAKDVITGEASNNGQVGTTLALIEQGLQVFNATAKCTFRSLKDEFTLLKENIRKYGGQAAAQDYLEVLDDPEANFEADFDAKDMDIRPVSDPSSVTRMQKMAKGQFIMGTMEQLAMVGGDPREALRRVYEAADIEDIDKLLPPPQPPPPPDPRQDAAFETEMAGKQARAARDMAAARRSDAQSEIDVAETQIKAFQAGAKAAA